MCRLETNFQETICFKDLFNYLLNSVMQRLFLTVSDMRRLLSVRYKNLQITQLREFEIVVRAISLLDPFFGFTAKNSFP